MAKNWLEHHKSDAILVGGFPRESPFRQSFFTAAKQLLKLHDVEATAVIIDDDELDSADGKSLKCKKTPCVFLKSSGRRFDYVGDASISGDDLLAFFLRLPVKLPPAKRKPKGKARGHDEL